MSGGDSNSKIDKKDAPCKNNCVEIKREVNAELVGMLEGMLRDAKEGKMVHVTGYALWRGGFSEAFYTSGQAVNTSIGELMLVIRELENLRFD